MTDLILAILAIGLLSSAAYYLGRRLGANPRAANYVALLAVTFTLLFATMIHGRLFLAEWLPFSNVIVLSNWLPLFAAFLAGILRSNTGIPAGRRVAWGLALMAAGWSTVAWHVFPQDLTGSDRYLNGTCLQSTPATCSACSAVTILGLHGIQTNEQEMARLCLTSGRGTTLLGIYRGLNLKTEGTHYRTRIRHISLDEVVRQRRFPLLVPLRQQFASTTQLFPAEQSVFAFLTKLLGPTDHCVVLLGFDEADQKIMMADPANFLVNPVRMSISDLRDVWLDEGFEIVRSF